MTKWETHSSYQSLTIRHAYSSPNSLLAMKWASTAYPLNTWAHTVTKHYPLSTLYPISKSYILTTLKVMLVSKSTRWVVFDFSSIIIQVPFLWCFSTFRQMCFSPPFTRNILSLIPWPWGIQTLPLIIIHDNYPGHWGRFTKNSTKKTSIEAKSYFLQYKNEARLVALGSLQFLHQLLYIIYTQLSDNGYIPGIRSWLTLWGFAKTSGSTLLTPLRHFTLILYIFTL